MRKNTEQLAENMALLRLAARRRAGADGARAAQHRHKAASFVQGFVKGAYAAIGTILGACVLLGKLVIGDWLTVLIGLASLAVLFRLKVSKPLFIAATP